ncbi:hypothetical protein [Devosia elaeis]|uniref:hypothetical protein n=1 Tax=Devosia elaeis TaxID=1770058 RepID=UPI0013F4DA72|nr:hypothetical protein [Devosia elaeis]
MVSLSNHEAGNAKIHPAIVTTGLVPVVHARGKMDCRDKPGNDDNVERERPLFQPMD